MEKMIQLVSERMKNIQNDNFAEECKISNIDIDKWEWPQGVVCLGCIVITKDVVIKSF